MSGYLNPLLIEMQHKQSAEKYVSKVIAEIDNCEQNVTTETHATLRDRISSAMMSIKWVAYFDMNYLMHRLLRRQVAMEYRVGHEPTQPLLCTKRSEKLQRMAEQWISHQPHLNRNSNVDNSLQRLLSAGQYPKFARLLDSDQGLRHSYLQWTLEQGNQPELFIEFPYLQEKLTRSHLAERISRIEEGALKIDTNPQGKKIVTVPFEGRRVNFFDPKNEHIFKIFQSKTFDHGSLEIMRSGVTMWNSHQLSRNGKQIDLDQARWWEQLPVLSTMATEEVQRTYHEHLNGGNWCMAAHVTKGSEGLDIITNHAALDVLIPNGDGYNIYSIGKLMANFPETAIEYLKEFQKTVPAAVVYPDEVVYQHDRIHCYYALPLKDEQAEKLMQVLKEEILKARSGNLVFQIESENCAKWVQEVMEKVLGKKNIPELFRGSLLELNPIGSVGKVLRVIRRLPLAWQIPVVRAIHYPFKPERGMFIINKEGNKEWKSVTTSEFWRTGEVYVPSLLCERSRVINDE